MKKVLKYICVVLVGLVVAALVVYNNANADGPKPDNRNITMSVAKAEIGLEETDPDGTTLNFNFDGEASSIAIYLSIDNPDVITISGGEGVQYNSGEQCITKQGSASSISLNIKGKAAGTCTIKIDPDKSTAVTYPEGDSYTATNLSDLQAKITVKEAEEDSTLVLSPTELNLKVGGEAGTIKSNIAVSNWSSDNEYVATVKDGVVTPIGEGDAEITATTEDGKSATANVHVDAADDKDGPSVDVESIYMKVADRRDISITNDKDVTWETSNNLVVSIVNQDGRKCTIIANKVGTATITARSKEHPENSKSIEVNVSEDDPNGEQEAAPKITSSVDITLNVGENSKATADQAVEWSSGNTDVATVDSDGNIVAVGAGETVITAKNAKGKTAEIKVTVKNKDSSGNGSGSGSSNGSGSSAGSVSSSGGSTGSAKSSQRKSSSSANSPAPATGESPVGIVLVIGVVIFIIVAIIFRKKGK